MGKTTILCHRMSAWAAAFGGGELTFYLYGTPLTRLGDGDYHPSWTAEERIVLQQAEHYLLLVGRDKTEKSCGQPSGFSAGKSLHLSLSSHGLNNRTVFRLEEAVQTW